MFEHEKYSPLGEDAVIAEMIGQLDRLSGPQWHLECMDPNTANAYRRDIKNASEKFIIELIAETKLVAIRNLLTYHRPLLLAFWHTMKKLGVAEVTYTEEEAKNMRLWLEHNQDKLQ